MLSFLYSILIYVIESVRSLFEPPPEKEEPKSPPPPKKDPKEEKRKAEQAKKAEEAKKAAAEKKRKAAAARKAAAEKKRKAAEAKKAEEAAKKAAEEKRKAEEAAKLKAAEKAKKKAEKEKAQKAERARESKLGDLGITRPLLAIIPPSVRQQDMPDITRDDFVKMRLGYGYRVETFPNIENKQVADYIHRYHPTKYEQGTEEYMKVYRNDGPILVDIWKFRRHCLSTLHQQFRAIDIEAPDQVQWTGPSKKRYQLVFDSYFIEVQYGKDSRYLRFNSDYNEGFKIVRVWDNKEYPWRVDELDHSQMLWYKDIFKRIKIDRSVK